MDTAGDGILARPRLLTLAWRGIAKSRDGRGAPARRLAFSIARGWFRRFPFLPLPAREYLRWRMYTAYGDEHVVPPAGDVIRYARWAVRDS